MSSLKGVSWLLIAGIVTFSLFRCSPGSSETGNAFTINGSLVMTSGKHAVLVQLIPESFNPFISDSSRLIYKTTIDSNGNYFFDSIPQGNYYLGAFDSMMQYGLLKGPYEFIDETVDMGRDTLKKTSTVILSFETDSLSNKPVGVFIKGTTCLSYVYDSTRYVNLQNIPSGKINVMQSTFSNTTIAFVESLTVQPGDTVNASYKNRPPVILSEIPLVKLFNFDTIYIDTIRAEDPDSEKVTFSVISGPQSFKIDSISGVIYWNTALDTGRFYQIVLRVKDPHGLSTSVQWTFENRNAFLAPTPDIPEGNTVCALDSAYIYTIDTCQCFSQPSLYRFSWGDGDTSLWSPNNFSSHTWIRSGVFNVKAQFKCPDYSKESAFSDPVSIFVHKNEITETPKPGVFNPIAANTLFNPGLASYSCDGETFFKCYINDSCITGWKNYEDFWIKLEQPGTYYMRIAAWCDTARKMPSPVSDPCTLTVYKDSLSKMPNPILMGDTSYFFDTLNSVQLNYRVFQDTSFDSCQYRFLVIPGDTTPWGLDTVYAITLMKPDSTTYRIGAQARCPGIKESEWSFLYLHNKKN